MPHYNDDVSSTLSQAKLFDYMADFTHAVEWDPGTKMAKRLDDGTIGVGSEFELVVEFAGNDAPFVYKITEYDRPNVLVVEADSEAVHLVDTMTSSKDGKGSTLNYDARLDLKGWRKVTTPIMALLFNRLCKKGKDGLERELNPSAVN